MKNKIKTIAIDLFVKQSEHQLYENLLEKAIDFDSEIQTTLKKLSKQKGKKKTLSIREALAIERLILILTLLHPKTQKAVKEIYKLLLKRDKSIHRFVHELFKK